MGSIKASALCSSEIELEEAVRKLEAFSQEPSKSPALISPVAKTIAFVLGLFSSDNPPIDPSAQNEIFLQAEVIRRKRFYIQQLQNGSPAEQKLAAAVENVVEAYNKRCSAIHSAGKKRTQKSSAKNKNDISLLRIDLPKMQTIRVNYPSAQATAASEEVISATKVDFTKQAGELFQMKVIALLERYGIASNPEARHTVKRSPILSSAIKVNDTTCLLTHTLELFPGQTITVRGTSAWDPQTRTVHKLFPETFSLSLESNHTGFPECSQRAGWCAPGQLLPNYPQRIDLLTHTAQIFREKNEIALEMLPGCVLMDKTKQLMRLKKHVYVSHSSELLQMHQNFMHTFVKAYYAEASTDGTETIIDNFYQQLATTSEPLTHLIEVHQRIREIYVRNPHKKLMKELSKRDLSTRDVSSPEDRFIFIKEFLQTCLDECLQVPPQSYEEKYMHCLGSILGQASASIILQYLSEDLAYPPPQLSAFEKKLQEMAYKQAADFAHELRQTESSAVNVKETVYLHMKAYIQADLQMFAQEADLPIANELADYFEQRYRSLS